MRKNAPYPLCFFNKTNNKQQQDSPGSCHNNRTNQPARRNTEQPKYKATNNSADNADNDITEQAKPPTFHDLAS